MRVLVTGASGFLGSHVAERLAGEGHTVRCLVRRSSKVEHLRGLADRGQPVELVEGAIDDAASLPAAVKDVDAIVHCAGVVKARSWDDFLRVNERGAADLAQAAIDHAPGLRRFVLVSSAGVMGPGAEGRHHTPDDAPNPVTLYGKSKLAGEKAVLRLADRLPVTILRPPAIYGPRDQEILAFFQAIRRTRSAFRLGESMKSIALVYAEDAADACARAALTDVPSGSTYFVDDGEIYSYEQMAGHIADAYGIRLLVQASVPRSLLGIAARASEVFGRATDRAVMFSRDKLNELLIEHFTVDSSTTRRDLGWAPQVTFREGARRTAQWYREHGWD